MAAPKPWEHMKPRATAACTLLVGVRLLGVCCTSRYIHGTVEVTLKAIAAQGGRAKDRASAGYITALPSAYHIIMLSQSTSEKVVPRLHAHTSNMVDATHNRMKKAVHACRAAEEPGLEATIELVELVAGVA